MRLFVPIFAAALTVSCSVADAAPAPARCVPIHTMRRASIETTARRVCPAPPVFPPTR